MVFKRDKNIITHLSGIVKSYLIVNVVRAWNKHYVEAFSNVNGHEGVPFSTNSNLISYIFAFCNGVNLVFVVSE